MTRFDSHLALWAKRAFRIACWLPKPLWPAAHWALRPFVKQWGAAR